MIEEWLDRVVGKKVRKALEQLGHALMSGLPALTVPYLGLLIGLPAASAAALGATVGMILGLTREYIQNIGDAPDETTLFVIEDLPVNKDMLIDITAYFIGAVTGGLVFTWIVS